MSITINPLVVPTGITILWILIVALAAFAERNDTGLMAGLWTACCAYFGFIAVLMCWITFALVRWLS